MIERYITLYGSEPSRQWKLLERCPQVLSNFATDSISISDNLIERAIFLQPLGGSLGTNLGNTGDVIHRIADKGEIIDDAFGGYAELLLYARTI